MSHPTFSKGSKSREVTPLPLGKRMDFVSAHASQGATNDVVLMLIPNCSYCMRLTRSCEMWPSRLCHSGAGNAFGVLLVAAVIATSEG